MGWLCLVVWLISAFVAGAIGSGKGEAGKAAIVGFLFGPVGVALALLSGGDRRECPHCREPVRAQATICPHCRSEIEAAPPKNDTGLYVVAGVLVVGLLAFMAWVRTL